MKTWQKVVGAVLFVLAALVVFVATRPDHFSVVRSTEMAAPPEKIYALVADFHEWQKWSPWDKLDPGMKRTYEGDAGTLNHTYAWQGNKDVGKGKMAMMALEPGRLVRIKLDFLEPFPVTNDTRFTFVANSGKTNVFWTMEGENKTLMHKAFGLFMDSMVGPDFEQGLAAMKLAAEAK